MLLYFTFNFIYSVSLFKAQVLGKSDTPSLPESVKMFYFAACFSAAYSLIATFIEFLLLRLIQ